jgi:hypothetical protein
MGHLPSGPSGPYLDVFAAALERSAGKGNAVDIGVCRPAAAVLRNAEWHLRRAAFRRPDRLIALLKRLS